MCTLKKILFSCIIVLLQTCTPQEEEEKQPPSQSADVLTEDLMRQAAVMDSIVAAQEMEFAQQIIVKQQFMNLKSKTTKRKSRSNGRDSKEKLVAEEAPAEK